MTQHKIHSDAARQKLTPRREPYFSEPLKPGLFVGFRKLAQGGTWIARCRHDGKQHFKALGGAAFLDFDAAKNAALVFGASIHGDVDVKAASTLAELAALYVADLTQRSGEAVGLEAQQRFALKLDGHALGKTKLDKLKADAIEAWRDGLTRENGKPMADGSKNRHMAGVVAALNYGVEKAYLPENATRHWRHIGRLKEQTENERYLTPAQRNTLLDALPAELRPLLTMLKLIPLRPGAAAHLTVGAFNPHTRELRIKKDKTGPRTITVGNAVAAHILAHSKDKLPGALLFPGDGGKVMPRQAWGDAIRHAREALGLPADTCGYSFRHSGITDLLLAGVDALTVAKLSGTSIRQIDRTYGHLVGHHAAKALDVLAG